MSIDRRNLVKGAAWAVPAVTLATTMPAFAASQPCPPSAMGSVTLKNPSTQFNAGSTVSGTHTASTAGLTVSSKHTIVGLNPDTTRGQEYNYSTGRYEYTGWNGRVDDPSGLSGWIEITHYPYATTATNPARYQDFTFSFSKPVYNLTFTIADIDNISDGYPDGYHDHVAISAINGTSPTGKYSATAGSNITGSGTLTSPWKTTKTRTTSSGVTPGTATHAVKVTIPGPVTSTTLRYWSTVTSTYNTQAIWFGNVTYTTQPCML